MRFYTLCVEKNAVYYFYPFSFDNKSDIKMELVESDKLPLLPTSHDKDLMKIVLAAAGKFGPGSLQSFSEILLKKDEK